MQVRVHEGRRVQVKYSDDQPRDEDGRFTSEGDTGGSISVSDAKQLKNALSQPGASKFDKQFFVNLSNAHRNGYMALGKETGVNPVLLARAYRANKTVDKYIKENGDTKSQNVAKDDKGRQMYGRLEPDGTLTPDPNGKYPLYSPERQAMHNEIVKSFLKENAGVPADHKLVSTAGPPGAGKSWILANGKIPGVDPKNFVHLDPDDFKARLISAGGAPKIADLSPMETAAAIHSESSDLSKQAKAAVLAQGKNIILDGVDSGQHSYITQAVKNGYTKDNTLVQVNIPMKQSEVSTLRRYAADQAKYNQTGEGPGGRIVPPQFLHSFSNSWFKQAYQGNKPNFHKSILVDNTIDPKTGKPKNDIGPLETHDPSKNYDNMLNPPPPPKYDFKPSAHSGDLSHEDIQKLLDSINKLPEYKPDGETPKKVGWANG